MRALTGLSLSGVAAVAMTYLSEEIHPNFIALSMGLYISGSSIGGMRAFGGWGIKRSFLARITASTRIICFSCCLLVLVYPPSV